jgi:hypothetical protein
MTPLSDLELGDVVQHVGIIAGTDWTAMVTAIDYQEGGGAIVYETGYPRLSKRTVAPKAYLSVVHHDDDALKRALRMFADGEESEAS